MTIRKRSSEYSTTEYWLVKKFREGWENISGCILQPQLNLLKKLSGAVITYLRDLKYSELKFKNSFDKFLLTLTNVRVRFQLKGKLGSRNILPYMKAHMPSVSNIVVIWCSTDLNFSSGTLKSAAILNLANGVEAMT